VLAFDLQGGGLLVYGTATLINSNVYENEASTSVRSLFEPSMTFHPSPLWMELDLALVVDRAVASMSIATEWLTLKAATSTTTPRLIMCVRILIFPCTFIHRPDEMFCRLLASLQGAGLYIYGTATLINSNVYENEASRSVCSLF